MMPDEVLFRNQWMSVRVRNGWYTYSHNEKGDGVGILIWDSEKGKILVRSEHNPCHIPLAGEENEDEREYTSFTGTIENGLSPEETAVLETKEESGYEIIKDDLTPLGWIYPFKFSDYKQYLFAIDVKGKTSGKILGDGTRGEEDATTEWFSTNEAIFLNEPLIGTMLMRLMNGFLKNG